MVTAIVLSAHWLVLFAPLACLPLLLARPDPGLPAGRAAPTGWDETPAPRDAPTAGESVLGGRDERHEAA